jgi:hypothetical protein
MRPRDNEDVAGNQGAQEQEQKPHVPNPFDPQDAGQISKEDIENEQKFKEAMTERD